MELHDYYECGLDAAFDVVTGKWKSMVLWALEENGTLRFGELRRELTGVSEKVLVQQLRDLERDGIVNRVVYPEVPPKVEYSLTDLGVSLSAALDALTAWGEQHFADVLRSRATASPAVSVG